MSTENLAMETKAGTGFVELFQAALEENIIVYLPTGSGKTFIAALLIKEKTHEVTKPLDLGGKRTVFLVPTIVLAIQQAAYLRRHTYLKVKEFYGSMGVDFWGKERWKTEFEENHVLVMTAQIFVDVLNHAFFSAYQLNLLVFDECHAAVKDAPMKQVLSKLQSYESSRRPKILGLTAALFRMRCKPHKVPEVIQKLSESMGCIVKIPSSVETVYRSSTKPCEIVLQYDDENNKQNPYSLTLSVIILDMVFKLMEEFKNSYGELITKVESDVAKHPDKIDMLLDALKDIDYLLRALGPYGAYHCAHVYIRILQQAKSRVKVPQFLADLNKVSALCREIKEICTSYFAKFSPKDRLLLFVHPKVIRLLEVIRNFSPEKNLDERQRVNPKMCAIIFVERRCMANGLYHFLKDVAKHDETLEFMKPLFTMGQASGRNASLKETKILNMKQNEIMTNFREGRCNLIVATSVLEEGVDIPACNLIVRFDHIKTYCDYVQTKETSDPNEQLASNIDVPKVLGDIFESVAGAIFLDSGMSLDAVWQSYLPFLHDALEKFNESIPVSALRKLHERHPTGLKIRKSESLPDGRVCVAIEIEGTRVFKGAGGNSKTAKSAAAKYALCVDLTKSKPT
ncbi:Uncharacterized protein APZ42_032147 [Daphnia magna]|uniref:Uncharacterized protein n=1 Tax=Daphnia magna TaxID=35525 RepID=A0A164M6R7_9CRUS|nr:Uncharacterized protein APZ42_032147 [Daphnia magna]